MRTLITYFTVYPRRSFYVLLAFLAAGVAEALSLTAILPLLSIAIGDPVDSNIGKFIVQLLDRVDIDPTIGAMLLIILCGIIIKSLVLLVANRQIGYTVANIATKLRLELIEALFASRWQYYLRQPVGSLTNSIATEASRAAIGFSHAAAVLSLSIQVFVYILIALLVSWQAALTSLIIGVIFLASMSRLIRVARKAGTKQTLLYRKLLTYLADVLGSAKPLKAMARDKVTDSILRSQTTQLEKATRREVMSRESLKAIQEPILAAFTTGGLYAVLVIWELPLSAVAAMVILFVRILTLSGKMQRRYQNLLVFESAYWSIRRASEAARSSAEMKTGRLHPTLKQGISLQHVDFNYDNKVIFRNLNMEIQVKSFTTITGNSGAGKSTLIDLLCGLVEPKFGDIFVDGISIHEINIREWRRLIGYVSQETILLHDTILSNILVGAPDLTQADAEKALHQAGAWEFVSALPEGLHTIVGERGGLISGGQRQCIAIARALAHQPQLLLLDEPTSALDPKSEQNICKTLRNLSRSLTIIAVSHQPALANAADYVIRLSNGEAKLLTKSSSTPYAASL
ncbi:MAG: ABC transporter ATP-binding protein [Nitrosomonadaceae bacterium]